MKKVVTYYQIFFTHLLIILRVYPYFLVNNFHGIFGIYELPVAVSYVLTIFITVLIINAINLIDGIDGLASGLSSVALAVYGFWFLSESLRCPV